MSLLTNLQAFWELEEASGTRNDAHSTNHLSDVNTVTQAAGKVGNAGQFTGANSEHLSIADNAALSTGDIDFTIAAWVYMDSKGTGFNANIIASKYGAGGQNVDHEWWLGYTGQASDLFQLVVRPGTGTLGTVQALNLGAPSTATWYYVVAWHDAVNNTINIQVNNGTADSQAYSTGTIDGSGAFEIGDASGGVGAPFDGRIDQVGFWKRVLTAQERTDLYNGGSGLSYAAMGGSSPSAPFVEWMPIVRMTQRQSWKAVPSGFTPPDRND